VDGDLGNDDLLVDARLYRRAVAAIADATEAGEPIGQSLG